jgi:hypothetical protein
MHLRNRHSSLPACAMQHCSMQPVSGRIEGEKRIQTMHTDILWYTHVFWLSTHLHHTCSHHSIAPAPTRPPYRVTDG